MTDVSEDAEPTLAERDRMPRWVPRAIGLALGGVVLLGIAAWLLDKLQSLLVVFLISLFLSFAMEPAVKWLENRGLRRGVGTALVFLAFLAAAAGFVIAIASVLASQIRTLIDAAPGYLRDLQRWVFDRFGIEIATDNLISQFTAGGTAANVLNDVAGGLVSVGSTVVNLLVQLLTVVLFTFYLLADGPRLRRLLCSALNPRRQTMMLRGWELAIDKTGGYIYSRALLAFVAFAVHWLVFALIGVPFPLPLAMWVGILSQFVPVVGTYLAGLLPLLVALLDNPVSAIWVLAVVLGYQQIENYLLAPRITAKTMNVHAAVAFGSVLVGAAILGGVGALLAVPAAATIQAIVSTYIKRHELISSDLLEGGEPGEAAESAYGEASSGEGESGGG